MAISSQFVCLFFFLRKDFERKNSPERKNQLLPSSSFCASKKLLPLLVSIHLSLLCLLEFAGDVLFCAQNLFVIKHKVV